MVMTCLRICANPDNLNLNSRKECKQKGFHAIKRDPIPVAGPSVPLKKPPVPLTGAF